MSSPPSIRAGHVGPVTGLAGATVAGLAMGAALAGNPPPAVAVAGIVAAAGVLALAAARYELTIALGFLLLGVVRVEPAPTDALLAAVIALALAAGAVDLRRVPRSMVAVLVGLLVLNVLSLAAAEDLGESLRFLSITLYLGVLAVWLTSFLRTRERMRLVIGAYVAGAVASAALALLALFVAFPGHELFGGEGVVRAQGLFKDPNVFGPFLVPAALILLEEALRPRLFRLPRAVSGGLVALLALGIVFSYSRAGWLNFAIALLAMLMVMSLRPGAARVAVATLALVTVVGAITGTAVVLSGSTTFLQERARVQTYDTARFTAQRTGLRLAAEHPLGVGPGQFERDQPVSAHSIYVRVLAEQGVPGLVVLIALLAGTLALAVGNAAAGRDAYGVGSAVLLGAWCGLLANSAFVDTLHWRHLWLLAALIWVAAARRAR